MTDSKVFMVPDGATGKNAVDPNLLLSMMGNGGFGGNGNWLWVIFLFFLNGWNRGGFFGGNGGSSSSVEREMLMQAISGNGQAIGNLATTLNCDINSVKNAICSVQSAVCNVGTQVGLTGQQVINSIQQGNMSLAQQFAQCCCDNKLLVTQMGYEGQIRDLQNTSTIASRIDNFQNAVQSSFSDTQYQAATQTCSINQNVQAQTQAIRDTANANTQAILAKLDAMQTSSLQDKIAELQEAKSSLKNQISQEQQNQTIAAMIAPLQEQINAVKAAQPSTTTVQYPQLTVVPNYVAAYGYGNGYSFWN